MHSRQDIVGQAERLDNGSNGLAFGDTFPQAVLDRQAAEILVHAGDDALAGRIFSAAS